MQIELMGHSVRGDALTFRTCVNALELVRIDECKTVADINVACLRAAVNTPEKLRRLVLRVFPEIFETQYEKISAEKVLGALYSIVTYSFFRLATGGSEGSSASQASTGEVLHCLMDALCMRYRMSPFEVNDRAFDEVLQLADDLHQYGRWDNGETVKNGKRTVSCPVIS